MSAPDLNTLAPGFEHEAFGSQAVFRAALQALSHPGRPVDMPVGAAVPRSGHLTAAVLLLGLLDADTRLWLSPSLAASDAAAWLRFHTGCPLVTDLSQAQFCWFGQGEDWPDLADLNPGTDTWPDQSATCVVEVESLRGDTPGWTLQGPGIAGERHLQVRGLPASFESQWQDNHARFPRGVDVFLASPTQIVGLPRTTHLQHAAEV
jgi:alpha-D-ribose 1-methylphosphonate 5-triphosphate synthase subunit PhnH